MAEEHKCRIYKVMDLEEKNVHSDQEKWGEINDNPGARDRQYEDLGSKGWYSISGTELSSSPTSIEVIKILGRKSIIFCFS